MASSFTRYFQFRTDDKDLELFRRAAKKKRLSVSAWVRIELLKAANNGKHKNENHTH